MIYCKNNVFQITFSFTLIYACHVKEIQQEMVIKYLISFRFYHFDLMIRMEDLMNCLLCPDLAIVVAVFGVCWAPFHIERLLWSSISHWTDLMHNVYQYVHIVSGFFFYLSSAVNPIIYSLLSTRFRECFREIMCSQSEDRKSVRDSPPFPKISLNHSVSSSRAHTKCKDTNGLIPLLPLNVAQNAGTSIPTCATKERTSEF